MEEGFQKGDSHNLPQVDVNMVFDFLAMNTDYNQVESSGVKAKTTASPQKVSFLLLAKQYTILCRNTSLHKLTLKWSSQQ